MNKIVLVLTGIVLLAIAAFAALWFRVGGELQDLAEDILVAWREGRVEQIRADASGAFRKGQDAAQFRAYLDHWSGRLGPFVKVVRRKGVSTSSTDAGTRKSVRLELEFEKGKAEGLFDFEVVDDDLRLMHLSLRAPREPVEKADRSALQAEARSLFGSYSDQALVALYAALSPALQMEWGPGLGQAHLEALHRKAGRVTKVELLGEEQPADDRHLQKFGLTFERGSGSSIVEWLWESKRWEIVAFKMNVDR